MSTSNTIKLTCGCGRSPTGRCIGWHSLPEETYMDKYKQWLADNCRQTNIITKGGSDIWKYEFESFEAVENFFIGNIDRWKSQGKATKVIGHSIFVFTK